MSIFPTKVLLATDDSGDAEIAATTAVSLAKNTSSEVHVVHVWRPGAFCALRRARKAGDAARGARGTR